MSELEKVFVFENKVCVVCGPLGPIGLGILSSLIHNDNTLVLVGIEVPKLEELRQKLYGMARENKVVLRDIDIIECDVSKKEQIDAAVRELYSKHKQIDAFFYNTGIMYNTSEDSKDSTSRFCKLMSINFYPFVDFVERLEPLLFAASSPDKKARVIATGSVSGIRPRHCNYAAYATSKTCLHSYVRAKDKILQKTPDRRYLIYAIAPGMFESAMTSQLADSNVQNDNLVARYGNPTDIANLVSLLLASPVEIASNIIPLDGGYLAQ